MKNYWRMVTIACILDQRLIWDIGLVLVFSGPTAFQKRNIQHLLNDFTHEYDLYTKSGVLIAFLRNWKTHSASLKHLIVSLVENRFFKGEKSTLVQEGIRTLQKAQNQRIGYSLSR